MKEGYKKWGMYAIIGFAIFIISILLGFFLSRDKNEIPVQTLVKIIELPEPETEQEALGSEEEYYIIKADGEKLKLHYIKGEDVLELKSEEFSENVFPEEDIKALLKGIRTETCEEAFSVWENFIS